MTSNEEFAERLIAAFFAKWPRQDDPAPYGREWGDEGAPLDQTIDDAMAGKPSKLQAYERTVFLDKVAALIREEAKQLDNTHDPKPERYQTGYQR